MGSNPTLSATVSCYRYGSSFFYIPPLSTSQKERRKPATSICHIDFLSSIIYAKEIDILRSKPNVVSVCRGVYRSLFPVKLQLCVIASWRGVPYYLNDTNARRARCTTRKLRQSHVHLYHNCIYAKRARHTPAEHLPERTAQTCYFHMSH